MTAGPQRRPTTLATIAANTRDLDLSEGTHGTVYTPGQESVDPQRVAKVARPTYDISDPDKVYYTAKDREPSGRPENGWSWAMSAARSRGEPTLPIKRSTVSGLTMPNPVMGRPVVHNVEAHGKIDIDPNMGEDQKREFTADKLTIHDTQWIRPPWRDTGSIRTEEIGVQGTLPHMNWNQFADPKRLEGMDLNNPGISAATGHMKGTPEHDAALQTIKKRDRVKNFGKVGDREFLPLRNDPYPDEPPKPRARDYTQEPMF